MIKEIFTFIIIYVVILFIVYDILSFYFNYKHARETGGGSDYHKYMYFRDYIKYFLLKKNYKIIKKDSPIHGKGLFADEDIPANTFIIIPKNIAGNDEFLNDATFNYPKKFVSSDISKSLADYEINVNKHSKSNTELCTSLLNTNFVCHRTLKKIPKGTELTYDYGISKWLMYLLYDITDNNPFVAMNNVMSNYGKSLDSNNKHDRELQKNVIYLSNPDMKVKTFMSIGADKEKQQKLDALLSVMKKYNYTFDIVLKQLETKNNHKSLLRGKANEIFITELAKYLAFSV